MQEFIRDPGSAVIDRRYGKRGGLNDGKLAQK